MPTIPEIRDGAKVSVPILPAPIVDYKIITAANATALATAVKAEFSSGWIPFGSHHEYSASVWTQAMVKYS